VTNFSNKYYGFPKGKINEGEDGITCAIREVWEEIGIDVTSLISEENVITNNLKNESKTLYVVVGVNEQFTFNPNHMTRKEIGNIEWMNITELEFHKDLDKYLLIRPFIGPLKLFI
jgi:NUDIX domain